MGFFSDILPIATTAVGAYTGNPGLIASGLGMLGGAAQGQASQQANQQAAQAAQFRPVGITNTFGTSNFTYNPSTGQLESAGYTLSPQLQELQNAIMGGQRQSLQDVTALQNLGRGYLAQSPQEAAANWVAQQQALLQPSRDVQLSNIRNNLFQSGRGGLSVAQGGDLGAANPELQAYYNALAQQNAQLAAQGMQAGQQQVEFGRGLLSGAYAPLSAGLTASGAVEALGQQPLELSASLAGRSASAGEKAAKYLSQADYSSLGSLLTGAGTNKLLGQGILDAYNSFNLFGGTPQGAYGQQDQYLANAMSNPQTQQARALAAQMEGFDTIPQLSWYE